MKINRKYILYALVLIGVFLIISMPAFQMWIHFESRDVKFHIKRIDGVVQALKNMNFPYRINSVGNIGYGSADPIMYPYLLLYPVAIIYNICKDYTVAYNIYHIIIHIATGGIMYYSVQSLFHNHKISIMSTILISLSFFRLYDMYIGGFVGQYLACMFIPLVACGYANVLKGNYKKWIDVVIGLTLMLQSHVITTFYIGCLMVVITLILAKYILEHKILIKYILLIVFLVLFLNIWYIVPFVEYAMSNKILMPAVGFPWKQVGKLTLADHFYLMFQIFAFYFYVSFKDIVDMKVSYMTIFIILFLIIYFIYKLIYNKKNKTKKVISIDDKIIMVFLIIFLYTLIASAGIFSRTFLAKISIIQKFYALQQFEGRELRRGIILLYIGFSYIVEKYIKKYNILLAITIVLGIIPLYGLYTYAYSAPIHYDNCYEFANSDYMLKQTLDGAIRDHVKLEYKYKLPHNIFDGSIRLSDKSIAVTNEKRGYLSYSLDYEVRDDGEHYIDFPLFNYPGYKAYNGKNKKLKIKTGTNALISVQLKEKKGSIKIKFEESILWLVCDILSLLTLIGLIVGKTLVYVKNKHDKTK